MSIQERKCSKCYSKYGGLKKEICMSSCEFHECFFKKDEQLFCIHCLLAKGYVKCCYCRKLISCYDDLGTFRWSAVLPKYHAPSDHDIDVKYSTCSCRTCSHVGKFGKENETKETPWWKDKSKSKPCRGTFFSQDSGERECNLAIPIDGGDFCKHCKGQTETYQQRKIRLEAQSKQKFEEHRKFREKAQKYWNSLSSCEKEKELERVVKNMKLGRYRTNNVKEGEGSGWTYDGSFWTIKNEKFISSSPHLVPIQIVEEFIEKEMGLHDSKDVALFGTQTVVVEENSDGNNPQQSPVNGSELTQNEGPQKKKVEIVKSQQNNPPKNNNEVLVIDLKDVNKIKFRENGKLEIEFNNTQNSSQVIDNEQINNSQELQKIRNYCRMNDKSTLNRQEINSALLASEVTETAATKRPEEGNNYLLLIGGGISIVLIIIVVIGLASKIVS